jgi:mono/diheme cytochrome c family protein
LADWTQGTVPSRDTESGDDELIARGAYLARSLGHCGECHTPRTSLGVSQLSREFAGAQLGEEKIEAIDREALAEWTRDNFDLFLLLGIKADGEFVGGDMSDVIDHNTSRLTDADRLALAAFFTR